jgi:type I restriction enzyme R subunit
VESERQTRRDRIDPRLKAAGWKVVEFKEGLPTTGLSGHAIAEYPTENGPVDYALIVDCQLRPAAGSSCAPDGARQACRRGTR